MLKDLVKVNFKWLEIVFLAGTACGAAMGLAAGMGLGYALGTVTAPKSGKELREDISDKTAELATMAKEKGQKLADKANELYSNVMEPDDELHAEAS